MYPTMSVCLDSDLIICVGPNLSIRVDPDLIVCFGPDLPSALIRT